MSKWAQPSPNLPSTGTLGLVKRTGSHQHVTNVLLDVVWQVHLAIVNDWYAVTVDEEFLEVPANVV